MSIAIVMVDRKKAWRRASCTSRMSFDWTVGPKGGEGEWEGRAKRWEGA